MSAPEPKYPDWICSSCGAKYGKRLFNRERVSCWHTGRCDICGIEASVTEPRDFGHLHDEWKVGWLTCELGHAQEQLERIRTLCMGSGVGLREDVLDVVK